MILEGIVTTLDARGSLNVAPMGPRVGPDFQTFLLRPFRGSNTQRNLVDHGEGVLHVVDDVLLLARSAIGRVTDVATRPAEVVRGEVILDCCRYYEFRVSSVDDREERVAFECRTVHEGRFREVFGFNRARHSVVEVAILATRIDFLPPAEVIQEVEKHRRIVEKTGGVREQEALTLLDDHIRRVALRRGVDPDEVPE